MKKGIEELGGTFVLDEFHIKKCIRKLVHVLGKEEQEDKIIQFLEKGERKKLEEWVKEQEGGLDEKRRKQLESSIGYIKKNWKAIRRRMGREDGVIGSSTESYISHVLSSRMSSRPMGWSQKGAGSLSQLRIYWKNGRKIEELVMPRKEKEEEKQEEESIGLSS